MKDALADNIKRHQEIQPVPAPELQVEESESFRRAHNDRYIRENPGHSPAQGGGEFFLWGSGPLSSPRWHRRWIQRKSGAAAMQLHKHYSRENQGLK